VPLENLTTTPELRASAGRRRNSSLETQRITPGALQDYTAMGWSASGKTYKNGDLLLVKEKSPDEILENRVWCCLHRFGYGDLNIDRNFKIEIATSNEKVVKKQIDVFAKDDETVIVIECKTAEDIKRKSLQKDIGEFDSLKKPISDAIRKHYGKDFKPKILWAFVISKIELSESDRARLAAQGTHLISDRELTYIEDLSRKLGRAGRQQFLAEYLGGQKIPALQDRKVPAIRTKIGGRHAYVFSATASEILKIAFVNHRDLKDPQGVPSYQRLIKPDRIAKIADYIADKGFFPNSILINFKKKVRFEMALQSDNPDTRFGYLYLPETYKSCMVVDGQHRLYGCAVLKEGVQSPNLMFIAFEQMESAQEAVLFATINREQRPVDKKLLDELDGDLKWDSDEPHERMQAIASRAIDLLNGKYGSPFLERVVSPGFKTTENRPLTLPEVRRAIISAGLIGRISGSGKEKLYVPGPFSGPTSEASLQRLMDALDWYFRQIAEANLHRWNLGMPGRVCNNFGVPAHLRLYGELIRHVEVAHAVDARQMTLEELGTHIGPFLAPVINFMKSASDEVFEKTFNVTLGSGGIRQYQFRLYLLIHEKDPNFKPHGLEDYIAEISQEQQEASDRDVRWIQERVHEQVVSVLREHYGANFFDLGIKNKAIQKKALEKRVDDEGEKQSPEVYLDFMDLKSIVEQSDNWPLFQKTMNIPLEGSNKGIAKHIKWFDEVNRIRRIPAHPFGRRYSANDVSIIRNVVENLRKAFA
jgi:DGQHR domain-containing protein